MKQTFSQQLPFSQACEYQVTHLLLALGSNHHADKYLPVAHTQLNKLGKVQFSNLFINPDFTATASNPKPDYSNQCAILCLDNPTNLGQLIQQTKQIECDCNRQHYRAKASKTDASIRLVSLDIDVLAIKLQTYSEWVAIAKRYPFKDHEWVGVTELL